MSLVYESNEINLIKLQDGIDGKPGKDGESGKTLYTWVKYSQYADGTNLTDDPTDAVYIGIAYNKEEQTESNNKTDYAWSKIKGDKGEQGERGLQGLQGEKGEQGIQGVAGSNGKTSYFHIKYSANSNGNPMTETPSTYIGTYVDYTEADSTDYTKYTWSRFQGIQGDKGDKGIPGTNGTNGKTSYLHIAYATSSDGSQGFSVSDSVNKAYIGQYTDFIESDSTDYKQYKWSKIKGEDGYTPVKGVDYFDGTNGKDGTSSYLWIRYATDSSGSGMTVTPSTSTTYIGTATTTINTAPSSASDYKWSKYVGSDGIPGEKGDDGKTAYLHIAYANSADGKTGFDISNGTGKLYIGQYTDSISTDSTDPTKYTWTKIKGEDGINGTNGKDGTSITIKSTSITYQSSSSGTTTPTGTWSTSVPNVSNGQYLWTKTVVNYSDGKSTTSYSVAYKGTNGNDGKGIKLTTVTYQAGASATTVPTGTWSTTLPSTSASTPFMWTKTVLTYTDNTTSTSYSVGSTPESIEVGGRNLLVDKNTSNGWVNKTGVIASSTDYKASDYISVTPGETLIFQLWCPSSTKIWIDDTYFDSNKKYLSGYGGEYITSDHIIKQYTVPSGASYVRISYGITDGYKVKLERGNRPTDWSPAPEDISVENIYTPNTTTIDGGKITTGSITADKINVNNLAAIVADIGLWHIEDGKLVADITKESIYDDYDILRHSVSAYEYTNGEISLRRTKQTLMNNYGIKMEYMESTNDPITTELYPGASEQEYSFESIEYTSRDIAYNAYGGIGTIGAEAAIHFSKIKTDKGYDSEITIDANNIVLDCRNPTNYGDITVKGHLKANSVTTTSGANLDIINSNLTYISNNNGKCWRFPNGMQICTKIVTFNSVSCTSAWGNLYETPALSLGNFASSFAEVPHVHVSCLIDSSGYSAGIVESIEKVTTSSAGNVYLCRGNSVTTKFKLYVTAIGRWK